MELRLTSPILRGQRVKNLQSALHTNKYGDFFKSQIDGQFGPLTAQGVYRAKFWLGYATKDLDQVAGDLLMDYLTGKTKLPLTKQVRRRARLKTAQKPKLRELAFQTALAEVGTKESPARTNCQKYGKWYGFNCVPWCAIFVTYCYDIHGSSTFNPKAAHYSYVPNIVYDARMGRNNLTVTHDPQKGDLVTYNFGGGEPDHVELFDRWLDGTHLRFATIGGNTSLSNQNNGGEVMRRDRFIHSVVLFAHVGA